MTNSTLTPSRRRWWLVGLAACALVLASAVSAQASGEQPPPGTVSHEPTSPQPNVTQPPAGAPAVSGAVSPQPELSQPPNRHPDLSGPSTQVVGPEVEGAGTPSEAGEVNTSVIGVPD